MNTRKQGDVGLGAAIAYFLGQGWSVSIPLTESQRYDLVVDDGALKRVEVKHTTYMRGGKYVATIKTCGGNMSGTGKTTPFDGNAVDYLFILAGDGSQWLIPGPEVGCKNSITLDVTRDHYRVGS